MKGIGQRDGRGMTTLGLGITLAVLVLLGLGGWTAYCYYDLLDRETELSKSLEGLALFRDARPTVTRIRARVVDKIRSQGGTVAPEEVRVLVEPLTPTTMARLPEVQQRKLNVACNLHGIQDARDAALERIRAASEAAEEVERGRVARTPVRPPRTPTGGKGCNAELLETLGYSFVQVEAPVKLRRGLLKRSVALKAVFYFSGPIRDDRASAKRPQGEDDPGDSDED